MADVVTTQPSGQPEDIRQAPNLPPGEGGGDVTIRQMSAGDGGFVGELMVEAFQEKFEWAVGKHNVAKMKVLQGKFLEKLAAGDPNNTIFVASYRNERAGVMFLKFHGDREPSDDGDYCSELGCCGASGLLCMTCIIGEDSVPRGTCYLDRICVDSSFRGKGIGKVLMSRVDYEARKRGCRNVYLFVTQTNRAKNLYERQGFRVTRNEDGLCFAYCAVGIRKFYKMEKLL